jgi:hypothetical protein
VEIELPENHSKIKTMKKTILCLLTSLLAFTFIPNEIKAANNPPRTELTKESTDAEIALIKRLAEIKSMDKSDLSRSEKKANREEARSIHKKMRDGYTVVYISGGTLIIIILLLIILL